jgi:hypothetical protein
MPLYTASGKSDPVQRRAQPLVVLFRLVSVLHGKLCYAVCALQVVAQPLNLGMTPSQRTTGLVIVPGQGARQARDLIEHRI